MAIFASFSACNFFCISKASSHATFLMSPRTLDPPMLASIRLSFSSACRLAFLLSNNTALRASSSVQSESIDGVSTLPSLVSTSLSVISDLRRAAAAAAASAASGLISASRRARSMRALSSLPSMRWYFRIVNGSSPTVLNESRTLSFVNMSLSTSLEHQAQAVNSLSGRHFLASSFGE